MLMTCICVRDQQHTHTRNYREFIIIAYLYPLLARVLNVAHSNHAHATHTKNPCACTARDTSLPAASHLITARSRLAHASACTTQHNGIMQPANAGRCARAFAPFVCARYAAAAAAATHARRAHIRGERCAPGCAAEKPHTQKHQTHERTHAKHAASHVTKDAIHICGESIRGNVCVSHTWGGKTHHSCVRMCPWFWGVAVLCIPKTSCHYRKYAFKC